MMTIQTDPAKSVQLLTVWLIPADLAVNAPRASGKGYSVRSDGGRGQMWAVLYDDGTSLTTASEPIARSLAEAERQRGHQVTVRRLDDDADSAPVSEPAPALEPEPAPAAEPARVAEPAQVPGPPQAVTPAAEPARAAEPAQAAGPARARPAGRRRLVRYVLAAAAIVVAAALADHWDVLPSVGATTSSSSTQVGGPSDRPQLLPPLDRPPVMHFSTRARGG
jgi:hypothetical protein